MTDTSDETIATPADGPSLGIAPSGTCTCRSISANVSSWISSSSAWERIYVRAAVADSFITSPSLPVRVKPPLPFISEVSIKRITPPTGVQAKPIARPGPHVLAFISGKKRIGPRKSYRLSGMTVIFSSLPRAISLAAPRQIAAISRSRFHTPASLVYD